MHGRIYNPAIEFIFSYLSLMLGRLLMAFSLFIKYVGRILLVPNGDKISVFGVTVYGTFHEDMEVEKSSQKSS